VVSLLEIEKNKLHCTITEFETEKLLFVKERNELEDLVQKLKIESEEHLNMKTEVAEKLNKSEDELCLIRDRIMELEREIKYDKMAFDSKERELESDKVRLIKEKDKMLDVVLELESQKNELEDKLTKSDQKVDKLENENKILKNSELKSDLDRKQVIEKVNDLEADILHKKTEKKEFEEKMKNIIIKLDARISEIEAEKNDADVKIGRLEAENGLLKVENKFMKDKISKLDSCESKKRHKVVELQKNLDKLDDISDKQDIEIKTKTTEEYIEEENKKVVFEDKEELRRSTPDGAISERRPTPPQITNKTKSRIIKSPRDGKHQNPFL